MKGPGRDGMSDTFRVAPGATDERVVPLAGVGQQEVAISYSWTKDDRAASGASDVSFDSRQCANAWTASFSVDTTPDRSSASGEATCAA
ncbi:MAG TPA: hypothetical protein VHH36_10015 [Candidatus Thermoplasmatota archaeon]|nr:hypothetical protein [Candidatus Thermoplasmatota archaeon]